MDPTVGQGSHTSEARDSRERPQQPRDQARETHHRDHPGYRDGHGHGGGGRGSRGHGGYSYATASETPYMLLSNGYEHMYNPQHMLPELQPYLQHGLHGQQGYYGQNAAAAAAAAAMAHQHQPPPYSLQHVPHTVYGHAMPTAVPPPRPPTGSPPKMPMSAPLLPPPPPPWPPGEAPPLPPSPGLGSADACQPGDDTPPPPLPMEPWTSGAGAAPPPTSAAVSPAPPEAMATTVQHTTRHVAVSEHQVASAPSSTVSGGGPEGLGAAAAAGVMEGGSSAVSADDSSAGSAAAAAAAAAVPSRKPPPPPKIITANKPLVNPVLRKSAKLDSSTGKGVKPPFAGAGQDIEAAEEATPLDLAASFSYALTGCVPPAPVVPPVAIAGCAERAKLDTEPP
ncbi:hypothetical protein Vafri_2482, partial [Volvox africanus]